VALAAGHVPFFDDPGAVANVIRARALEAAITSERRSSQGRKP
jgi:hypothetical protein